MINNGDNNINKFLDSGDIDFLTTAQKIEVYKMVLPNLLDQMPIESTSVDEDGDQINHRRCTLFNSKLPTKKITSVGTYVDCST